MKTKNNQRKKITLKANVYSGAFLSDLNNTKDP